MREEHREWLREREREREGEREGGSVRTALRACEVPLHYSLSSRGPFWVCFGGRAEVE